MSVKALTYAEETLGVHECHEKAVAMIEVLDSVLSDLDKAQDRKRQLEEDYADREVELISEMRGLHPQMSDTRFRSELKGWERTDKRLRELRTELNKVRSEIGGLELDAEMARVRIKVNSSRMVELGGYLYYLGVVKTQAEQSKKTTGEQE